MEKERNKIKIEGVMQLSEVIANLEKLVADMKAGTVSLSAGDESLTLNPSVLVNVEMKAAQKKDKEKFSLEISWKLHKEIEGFAEGGE
jgi:amphi-Trp domain-containing protein